MLRIKEDGQEGRGENNARTELRNFNRDPHANSLIFVKFAAPTGINLRSRQSVSYLSSTRFLRKSSFFFAREIGSEREKELC